ncbi:MAG: phosphotransferase [bacterium]|nr:phosphotransferase [bacterium]
MAQEIDKKTPVDRLNYSGSLEPVVKRLSTAYGIGDTQNFSVIGVGYEDCNVIVKTDKGKYVAKIFQKGRTTEDITRYTTIMERAIEAGVNHPPLLQTREGNVIYSDTQANGLSLVLMRFIEGKIFFELNRAPDSEERKAIIEQATKINKIDHKPPYIFDSWAIPNIQAMFDKTKQFIKPEDLSLVERVLAKYRRIPVDTLPHCFVHGDFTKANVLKAENGDIYILDFSVANWYPRIQELAVIAANLMHDDTDTTSLKDKTELVAEEYDKFNKLTPEERKWLYDYALAGVAMEFMGAHQEKYINGNDTEETEYWLNLGREGLRSELS